MTAVAERATFVPARELPNGQPFYSAFGNFPFQADEVGEIIERTAPGADSGHIPVFDTGTGKTIISLAAAAFLFADDEIDQVVVIAELNAVDDWREATENHTQLSAHVYHGTGREKRLAKAGVPHVFITTYETGARELVTVTRSPGRKRGGSHSEGPLVGALGLLDKRTLYVFDEITKLRSRGSGLHQAYAWLLNRLARSGPHLRKVGLTATPMSRNFGDGYNIGRIACPERMPTVGEFEAEYVAGHDDFGHPVFHHDKAEQFGALFQGIISRKRKTDPDVACYFPRQHESATHVELLPDHADFYETIETLFDPAPGETDMRNSRQVVEDDRKLWNLLRITAGHPAGHLHAQNEISQAIAEEVGPDVLRAVGASKVAPLLAQLDRYRARGWPVVVFSFYKVVLFELARELDATGYSHVTYHGGLTRSARQKAYNTFRAGDTNVFLASDAAARGMNLQVSPAVIEYESSSTFLNRTQRINRVHRLTSPWSDVWCDTLILNGTVEDGTISLALDRNAEQDSMVGDDEDETGFISADTRRKLLKVTRRR